MGNTWSQLVPPRATFTEAEVPNLNGRVIIVTGATSGVGFQLALMLYHAGATVWVGGRSDASVDRAVAKLQKQPVPGQRVAGHLKAFVADLSDLATIRPAVERFLGQESRLDILFNNAAVSLPPRGSTSAQGHELMLATNCLAPYALASLLKKRMEETASRLAAASVRVIWTTSFFVEQSIPTEGMDLKLLKSPSNDQSLNYAQSKLGNYYLAAEFARTETESDGHCVIHLAQNPGNLQTNLLRHTSSLFRFAVRPLLYHAKQGAYTGLWAGLSPEISEKDNGFWIIPWGRLHPGLGANILDGIKSEEQGGTGKAQAFREWCQAETKEYL